MVLDGVDDVRPARDAANSSVAVGAAGCLRVRRGARYLQENRCIKNCTFGVMKKTHEIARKIGKSTASIVEKKNNKYMVSDCPLAGKHLKQLADDTNIINDEAMHPIEILAKAYKIVLR